MTGIATAAQILASIGDGPDYIDAPKPTPRPHAWKTRSDRPPCGTNGGYYVHRRAKQAACDACRAANAAAKTRQRRARGIMPRQPKEIPCGTAGGYRRHIKLAERTCQPCRDAMNEVQQAQREARRARTVRIGWRVEPLRELVDA